MSESKTIGVVLAGAGYLDGAEIHEAVLTLLALDEAGAKVQIFAPDVELEEVNHLTGKKTGQKRNVLLESARIARGKVADVATVSGTDVDGWVLPGGYGAAKNLCDFASQGARATPHKEVARVVREALAAHLPIGACCIAPALLASITKPSGPALRMTIGNDPDTAAALRAMGTEHQERSVSEVCVDEVHRVVTTPAYMYDAQVADVAQGIRKMVRQVLAWA